ncbi:MAG: FAD-binding protein [Thermoguttaceae bacterium]
MIFDTIIIGTGCAGFNAADTLFDLGHRSLIIITEGVNDGTSRNTGSDKQTYYKLSLAGPEGDSIREMARTLFEGGCVHGDTALIEAASSVRSFMKLVNLGVPFPTNSFGEYVGYKTDHDPRQRGTSCGPLTSKKMTEALEKSVRQKNIPILDKQIVIKILCYNNSVSGVITLSLTDFTFTTHYCNKIILATGGPAGIYAHSVYPKSQTGSTSLALEAGAKAVNLAEWQYGLASTSFRWNVSGTYQQVLPRYISIDSCGNEREFLYDYFDSPCDVLERVFLKGYQWPFDSRKQDGSSRIDLLVHEEMLKKRRVFLDFRSNPIGLEKLGDSNFSGDLSSDILGYEPQTYLKRSGAFFGTPIARLSKMNPSAIDIYRHNGIDIANEPLEIAVCAQHCNGGIAVDANWESSVKGLYIVGEAAGTFGVHRPGGSALNSTQVGSLRAAEAIVQIGLPIPALPNCASQSKQKLDANEKERLDKADNEMDEMLFSFDFADTSNVAASLKRRQILMSEYAGFLRQTDKLEEMHLSFCEELETFFQKVTIADPEELPLLFKNRDTLITQIAVLKSMIFSSQNIGTRGGSIVRRTDGSFGNTLSPHLDEVVTLSGNDVFFEKVRPLPEPDDWFENVWNEYNRTRITKTLPEIS